MYTFNADIGRTPVATVEVGNTGQHKSSLVKTEQKDVAGHTYLETGRLST